MQARQNALRALVLAFVLSSASLLLAPSPAHANEPRSRSSVALKKKGSKATPPAKSAAERPPPAPRPEATPLPEVRGPTRVDFDDRLVQGQTNTIGAVFLFDRKAASIDSMVRRRKSFRERTLETIYDP